MGQRAARAPAPHVRQGLGSKGGGVDGDAQGQAGVVLKPRDAHIPARGAGAEQATGRKGKAVSAALSCQGPWSEAYTWLYTPAWRCRCARWLALLGPLLRSRTICKKLTRVEGGLRLRTHVSFSQMMEMLGWRASCRAGRVGRQAVLLWQLRNVPCR